MKALKESKIFVYIYNLQSVNVKGSNENTTNNKKKLEKKSEEEKATKIIAEKPQAEIEGKPTKVRKTPKKTQKKTQKKTPTKTPKKTPKKTQEHASKVSKQKLTPAAVQSSPSTIENAKQEQDPKTTAVPSQKCSKQVPTLLKKNQKRMENSKQIPILLVKKGH